MIAALYVETACDRCTQGVMDATNPHLLGTCSCPCHVPGRVLARESSWYLLRLTAARGGSGLPPEAAG